MLLEMFAPAYSTMMHCVFIYMLLCECGRCEYGRSLRAVWGATWRRQCWSCMATADGWVWSSGTPPAAASSSVPATTTRYHISSTASSNEHGLHVLTSQVTPTHCNLPSNHVDQRKYSHLNRQINLLSVSDSSTCSSNQVNKFIK